MATALPKPIWQHVFRFVDDARTLCALERTCALFRALLLPLQNELWERAFGSGVFLTVTLLRNCTLEEVGWKGLYQRAVPESVKRGLHKEVITTAPTVMSVGVKRMREEEQEDEEERVQLQREIVEEQQLNEQEIAIVDDNDPASDNVDDDVDVDDVDVDEEIHMEDLGNELEDFFDNDNAEFLEDENNWVSLFRALKLADNGDTIVLLPGRYRRPAVFPFLRAFNSVHIVGCCFSCKYGQLTGKFKRHVGDMELGSLNAANIVICEHHNSVIEWFAPGGSIQNVLLQGTLGRGREKKDDAGEGTSQSSSSSNEEDEAENYFFGLEITSGSASVTCKNVGFASETHTACSVKCGTLVAQECHFISEKADGLFVGERGTVTLDRCIFRNNQTSGLDVDDARLVIQNSLIFSNRLMGISIVGDADVKVIDTNIFGNGLAGIEAARNVSRVPEVANSYISNNRTGVMLWRSKANAAESVSQIVETLSSRNTIVGNTVANIDVRQVNAIGDPVAEALAARVCTFLYTGAHAFPHKNAGACNTCGLLGAVFICEVCLEVCHAGHDTFAEETADDGKAYCDCCTLFKDCKFRNNNHAE